MKCLKFSNFIGFRRRLHAIKHAHTAGRARSPPPPREEAIFMLRFFDSLSHSR